LGHFLGEQGAGALEPVVLHECFLERLPGAGDVAAGRQDERPAATEDRQRRHQSQRPLDNLHHRVGQGRHDPSDSERRGADPVDALPDRSVEAGRYPEVDNGVDEAA